MRPNDPLTRPMHSDLPPSWPGARWISVLDGLPGAGAIALDDAQEYSRARLLIRDAGLVRGFVDVPITDSTIDGDAVRALATELLPATPAPLDPPLPSMSVVIGTRDRAELLRGALESVLALDYPDFDVVVIDNASRTADTRQVVDQLARDSPIRLQCIAEPRPGLANARNTGLRAAEGDIVAFTDDDVVVDSLWLRRLADGFARQPDVTCVTGLVPSGELRTPVQAYFEQRVSWASSCESRVFTLHRPPADVPLFPFKVGLFGTGANFAMRRDHAFRYGGFDEAFGVGSPTKGGEDIDMFVRVILAGHALAFEPSALVWHRHRCDIDALEHQAIGYGTGLSAWLTKIALDRRTNTLAMRRGIAGLRRARELAATAPVADDISVYPDLRAALEQIGGAERRAMLKGPLAYRRARKSGLRAQPLTDEALTRARP